MNTKDIQQKLNQLTKFSKDNKINLFKGEFEQKSHSMLAFNPEFDEIGEFLEFANTLQVKHLFYTTDTVPKDELNEKITELKERYPTATDILKKLKSFSDEADVLGYLSVTLISKDLNLEATVTYTTDFYTYIGSGFDSELDQFKDDNDIEDDDFDDEDNTPVLTDEKEAHFIEQLSNDTKFMKKKTKAERSAYARRALSNQEIELKAYEIENIASEAWDKIQSKE